jgi:hypothetical protein
MSVLRTQHLDAGVTGQVRNLRGARGGGASGTWSCFLLLFGLVSAGRTGLLAGVGQPEGLVSRRPGWRGVARGGAERGAGGGAERTHIPGAAFVGWSRRVRFTPRRRGPAVEVSNREISGLNVISQYARNLVITKDMILAKDPNRIDAQSLRDHGGIMRTRRFDTPVGYLTIFRGRAGEREDGVACRFGREGGIGERLTQNASRNGDE